MGATNATLTIPTWPGLRKGTATSFCSCDSKARFPHMNFSYWDKYTWPTCKQGNTNKTHTWTSGDLHHSLATIWKMHGYYFTECTYSIVIIPLCQKSSRCCQYSASSSTWWTWCQAPDMFRLVDSHPETRLSLWAPRWSRRPWDPWFECTEHCEYSFDSVSVFFLKLKAKKFFFPKKTMQYNKGSGCIWGSSIHLPAINATITDNEIILIKTVLGWGGRSPSPEPSHYGPYSGLEAWGSGPGAAAAPGAGAGAGAGPRPELLVPLVAPLHSSPLFSNRSFFLISLTSAFSCLRSALRRWRSALRTVLSPRRKNLREQSTNIISQNQS